MSYLKENSNIESGWTFSDADKIFAEKIQLSLPDKVFDFHTHLACADHIKPLPEIVKSGPEELDIQAWHDHVGFQVDSKRLSGALFTPYPSKHGDMEAANAYVLSEIEGHNDFFANILIAPDSTQETVEEYLKNNRVVGFKPYHVYAKHSDTFNCDINDFIPEWVWEFADERGLLILLHLVKNEALADKKNQQYICSMCEKYQNANLVLAHAARGFNPSKTEEGIASLRGLENVWFDTSAICEPKAIVAILREFGPRRLLWGSDFPISSLRGKCISLGSGFAWITTDQLDWNDKAFFGKPVQVGMESINAILNSFEQLGLNKQEVADVFCNNAHRLIGITKE